MQPKLTPELAAWVLEVFYKIPCAIGSMFMGHSGEGYMFQKICPLDIVVPLIENTQHPLQKTYHGFHSIQQISPFPQR